MPARGAFVLLVLFLLGCGESRTTVAGKVTCNGEPLKYGHILFEPIDANGEIPGGADVLNGEYKVDRITPGRKRVLIKSRPGPRLVAATASEREHVELVPPTDSIPATAEGNRTEVEVRRGDQHLDFDVKYQPKRK